MAFPAGDTGMNLPQQSVGAKPVSMPRDAQMAEMLASAGKEAQEQVAFHRSQLVMWERVQAATHAGLAQLHEDSPETEYHLSEKQEGRY